MPRKVEGSEVSTGHLGTVLCQRGGRGSSGEGTFPLREWQGQESTGGQDVVGEGAEAHLRHRKPRGALEGLERQGGTQLHGRDRAKEVLPVLRKREKEGQLGPDTWKEGKRAVTARC